MVRLCQASVLSPSKWELRFTWIPATSPDNLIWEQDLSMSELAAFQHPISDLSISVKISIPGSPDWIAIDEASVWISNQEKNSVVRVDPNTNQITNTIKVGSKPCSGLGVGFGSVWVPCCGQSQI